MVFCGHLLAALAVCSVVHGQKNFTIVHSSPKIVYSGSWLVHEGHVFSTDLAATAVFRFTGIAAYYSAPRWPHATNVLIALDDAELVLVNGTNPSAPIDSTYHPETEIVWGATGLSDSTHEIVVSIPENDSILVLGTLIYTVTTQSAMPPAAASDTPPGPSLLEVPLSVTPHRLFKRGSGSGAGAAAVGVIFGLAALIGLAIWIIRRNQSNPDAANRLEMSPVNQRASVMSGTPLYRSQIPRPGPSAGQVAYEEFRWESPSASYRQTTVGSPSTWYQNIALSHPQESYNRTSAIRLSPQSNNNNQLTYY